MKVNLTQTLWCDINRLPHRIFTVVSADLSQCFDSMVTPNAVSPYRVLELQ